MRNLTTSAVLLAATLLPSFFPGNGYGQCRTYSTSYSSHSYVPSRVVYSTPTYVAPSYATQATYVAPAKVYQQEYKAKNDQYFFTRLVAFFPVLDVPTYGAGIYAPAPNTQPAPAAPQQSSAAPSNAQLDAILTQLKSLNDGMVKLNDRVEKLERVREPLTSPAPKPEAGPPPKEEPLQSKAPPAPAPSASNLKQDAKALAVNAKACAACHAKGNESYGGEFVMSDDKGFTQWNDSQIRKVQQHLLKGTMPKLTGKRAEEHKIVALTDDEKAALFREVDRQLVMFK